MAERKQTVDQDLSLQQLLRARLENIPADPTGPDLVEGRVWWNSTDKRARAYDGSNVKTFAWDEFLFPLGGQWLLDPLEINAWGAIGPYDNTNTQDLGDVGDTTPASRAGGLVYPFDVKLKRFFAWHYNTNANAEGWGWVLLRQQKTAGSNAQSSVYILDEVADNGGIGPRDYSNTQTHNTDITLDATIPAGETIVLGVAAPTANTTNYYARIMSGYLQFERV